MDIDLVKMDREFYRKKTKIIVLINENREAAELFKKKSIEKYFKKQKINPATYYKGKKLRVRGILKPVNGALITATHPEQLEVK